MSINMGIFEYGKIAYFSVFTFFDILKKEVLQIDNICEHIVIAGLRRKIGFQTIPLRN